MKWPRVRVEEIAATGAGGTPLRNEGRRYFGGAIPWVKSGELRDGVLTSTEESITDEAIAESSAKRVPAGAVLVALYGATVGKTALLGIDATTNQAICHIIPDSRVAESKFVWFAMRAELPNLLRKRVGGAQPNISQQIVRTTTLPLPAPREQRRIVGLLEQADALRRQRAEADTLAARILPALFRKMFGDPERNPRGWPTDPFEQTCEDVTAGQPKTQRKDYLAAGTHPIVDQGQGFIAGYTEDSAALYSGELPVIAFGDHTRIFKLVDFPFGMGADGLRLFHPSTLFQPRFHYWQLCLLTVPSAGYSRHYKFLREKRLIRPPGDLQAAFDRSAAHCAKLAAERESTATNMETLFQTMLHHAFTGELTARWREAHLKELLAEMEQQAKVLNLPAAVN